jgi:hypothetical protein
MAKETAKIYDRRVVERYVKAGKISDSDLKSYMKSLPDESANADWVQLDLLDAEVSEGSLDENDSEENS